MAAGRVTTAKTTVATRLEFLTKEPQMRLFYAQIRYFIIQLNNKKKLIIYSKDY
jgi:hypothetical protein